MGIRSIVRRILCRKDSVQYADCNREMARIDAAHESFGLYDGPTRSKRVIVSLTSFPARFDYLHYAVGSILCQTMRPDRIILYLDDDVNLETLPSTLTELSNYGLEIETRPLDLKPHKKYYYAMLEHPDDIIITIDDDIMYPEGLIESLHAMHLLHPDCIVAGRAHDMRFDKKGKILPYRQWGWEDDTVGVPSASLCATGTGGVLYPPHLLHDDTLNYDLIKRLSPENDDLWLKFMETLVGTKTVLINQDYNKRRAIIDGSQKTNLNSSNVHMDANDTYIEKLFNHYRLDRAHFL